MILYWRKGVPLSSRTKDSSSAILFRRRVLSSKDGSSLKKQVEDVYIAWTRWLTWGQDRRFHRHRDRSDGCVNHTMEGWGQRTDQAQLYTTLARPFSVALNKKIFKKNWENKEMTEAHLSFGCMAIQATLSGSVPPPFPIFGWFTGVEGTNTVN